MKKTNALIHLMMHTLYNGRALPLYGALLGCLSGIFLWLLRPSQWTVYDRLWPLTQTTLYYIEAFYLIQLSMLLALLMFATRQKSQPLQWMLIVSIKGRVILVWAYLIEWLCGYMALLVMVWMMQALRAFMPYDMGVRLNSEGYLLITLWYHYVFCVLQWAVKQSKAYAYMAVVFCVFLASLTLNQGHIGALHPLLRLISFAMPSLYFEATLMLFGSWKVLLGLSVLVMGWLISYESTKDYIHHV